MTSLACGSLRAALSEPLAGGIRDAVVDPGVNFCALAADVSRVMVGGFNTNVRYRARVFHVQTEDSGEEHPHIVTLLYEGGAILTSNKQTYSDQLGSGDVVPNIRELMEQQHRAMVAALKAGDFDPVIDGPGADGETQPGIGEAPSGIGEAPSGIGEAPTNSGSESEEDDAVDDEAETGLRARRFGAGVITPRPLDEVILAHLT